MGINLPLTPLQQRENHVERLWNDRRRPTHLERQQRLLIHDYRRILHHLRSQLDALQDAVNDLTATTDIKHVIGGPPFLFPLPDSICNVEVRDEDGLLAGASGVTVMCAVVDDGRTLKLILSGPTTTDGAA